MGAGIATAVRCYAIVDRVMPIGRVRVRRGGMTRIAHLSDLHLVEEDHRSRVGAAALRLSWLTFGRTIDYEARCRRVARALQLATLGGADHVIVTGDLTEDGIDEQLELLGAILHESSIDPERVTLVPGNHDAYADGSAFERALEGPLAAFAKTSARGACTVLDDVIVLPISTAIAQSYTRSAGKLGSDAVARIDRAAQVAAELGRALIVAQHHPPTGHLVPAITYWDGLHDHASERALLVAHPGAHVLHGHTHREADRGVADRHPQVFCAGSVVDDAPVRFYDVEDGVVRPAVPRHAVPIRSTGGRERELRPAI